MNDDILQVIYKTVILSKLLHASSAWWDLGIDDLFEKGLNNQNHVLHKLLPEQSTHDY